MCDQIAEDAARISSWGFDLIKHDFSTYDLTGMFGMHPGMKGILEYQAPVKFHDNTLTTAQAMTRVYSAVRAGAGEKPVMSCNAVGHLTAGLSEIQRIGDDTSGREWARTRDYGVNALAFRIAQHGAFYAADPDCVGITEQIDWNLNRNFLDLVARSGTPLFVAADPNALTGEMEEAIACAFARAAGVPARAEPIDWMETKAPRVWRFDGEDIAYRWE